MRVGMHLGPFYASTSLGGRRRRRSSGSGELIVLMFQVVIWSFVTAMVICYFFLKGTLIAGTWLVGEISKAAQAKRAEQERVKQAAGEAEREAQSKVVASLKPEDLDWLKANGWQSPVAAPEPSRP